MQPPTQDLPAPPEPNRSMLRLGLFFYAAMAACALVWRWALDGELPVYAVDSPPLSGIAALRDVVLGALVGAGLIFVSHAMTRATAWGERLAFALAEILGQLPLRHALALALASGVAEEMLFRGALQPSLGWVPASLLFGLIHFVPRRDFLPWTGFAIAAGFLFGALFQWTGNLVAPVIAHVVVNGVNLPFLVRRYGTGRGRSG